MADRPDEVDHRVSGDRSAGLGLAQLPDAFLAERRDDSDTGLTGPDAQKIFDPLAERLRDAAHPKLEKFPPPYRSHRPDWLPLDVALAARPVLEPSR
jgi:hypothetical protein